MRARSRLASIGFSIFVVTSCGGGSDGGLGSTGGGVVVVRGIVTDYGGAPVAGMYVTADPVPDPVHVDPATLTAVRTAADGSFELAVPPAESRWVIVVLPERAASGAIAHAPTMGVVKSKPGVAVYDLPLRVPTAVRFDASAGSITVPSGARQVTLRVPQGAAGTFYVGGIDVAFGIPLDPEGGDSGTQLQSAGMIYVAPAPGSQMPAGGFGVDVGSDPVPAVPGADPFATWTLGPSGRWSQSAPSPDLAAVPNIEQFGFWNCDRNYRTACIKGKLKSRSGKTCAGGRVTQSGPAGVSSNDNAGADGSFCVMGAQTLAANVTIGGTRFQGTMPANPGDCSVPDTCAEVGEIVVDDADCPDDAPPTGGAPDAGSGGGPFSCDPYLSGDPAAPKVGACTVEFLRELCNRYGPTSCPSTYGASRTNLETAMTTFCSSNLLGCCTAAETAAASREWKQASFSILDFGGKAPGEPKYCTFFGYCQPVVGEPTDPQEVAACKKIVEDLKACNAKEWPQYKTWDGYAEACETEAGE